MVATGNAGTLNVRLTASTQSFARSMSGASKSLGRFKQSLQATSMAAGAAFVGFGLVGKTILTAGREFEKGMVRAGAIAQATDDQMKQMRKTALSLSSATEFTARQVADAFGNMAQRGLDVNKIMGAAPSVLQLASAAQLGVADAASISTNILNAYKLEVGELAKVNDILTAASNNAAIDVAGIGDAFKFVGSVGQTFKIDLEEMTAALGLLGSVGIPAEMAGTALKKVIPAISAARSASGKTRKVFDELGFTALSLATEGFPSLEQILQVVEERIAITGDTAKVAGQLMEVFGQRAGPALVALAGAGSEALSKLTGKIRASGGVAEDIANKQLNTFDGRMKILESQSEKLAISLSDSLIPMVDKLAAGLSGAIGFFDKLPGATKRSIVEFVGFSAAIMGVLAAMSLLVTILSPFVSLIAAAGGMVLSAFSLPILAAIGSVVGLIGIIGSLRKAWDANLFGMADAFKPLLANVSDLISDLKRLMVMAGKVKSDRQLEDDLRAKAGIRTETTASGAKVFTKEAQAKHLPNAQAAVEDVLSIVDADLRDRVAAALSEMVGASQGVGSSVTATPREDVTRGKFGNITAKGSPSMVDIMQRSGGAPPITFQVPAAAVIDSGFGAQIQADLKDTLGVGFDQVREIGGKLAEFAGRVDVSAFASRVDGLVASIAGGINTTKAFFAAIKAGTLATSSKAGKSILPPSAAKRVSLKVVGSFAGSIDSVGELLSKFGKEVGGALSAVAEFGSELGILPSVTRDTNGKITGTDPGSLLGGGATGSAVGAAMQGAAVAGPMGAVVGGIASVVSSSETTKAALDSLDGTFQLVGDGVAELIGALSPILGQLNLLVSSIMKPVGKLFGAFGKALQAFAPLFAVVAELFEALAPMVDAMVHIMGILAEAFGLFWQAISAVLRVVMLIVLAIFTALSMVWNKIVSAVQWVVRAIASVLPDILGGSKLKKFADSLESAKVDTDAMSSSLKDLAGEIADDPFATKFREEAIADGLEAFSDGLSDATEELLNVPRGFKVALARFQAITTGPTMGAGAGLSVGAAATGLSIPALATGGVTLGPTLALIGEQGTEAVMPLDRLESMLSVAASSGGGSGITIERMSVMADDPVSLFAQIRDEAERQQQISTGVGVLPGGGHIG